MLGNDLHYNLIQIGNGIGVSLLEQLLINRGVSNRDTMKRLITLQSDETFSPLLLDNMKDGAIMLIKHIQAGDKLFLQVDSDCDGITSSALFINYLNKLFPSYVQSKIYYQLHDEKVHGLLNFDRLPEDVKFVVIPDAGSEEFDLHKECSEKGIDVLILDHHHSSKVSEYACVINNQLCDYPNKALSGVGIVYKFCKYIDSLLNVAYADDFLDLVALGMIADMMDVRELETQQLIQEGLANVKNPLIKEMIAGDGRHFTEGQTPIMGDVAWFIAPKVNAITRAGTMAEKRLIFEGFLEFRAYEQIPSTKRGCSGQTETRVEQANRTMTNVKSRQDKAVESSLTPIRDRISSEGQDNNKILIIKVENGLALDKNFNGLVANKLSAEYQRPALILQKIIEPDGSIKWCGSARGYDKSDLKDFRQFLLDSNLVLYAQGHPNAFGVGIIDENIEVLREYCNTNLTMIDGSVSYNVDFIWDANNLNETDILSIGSYKYLWGYKLPEPQVLIKKVRLTQDSLAYIGTNQNTLRITFPNGITGIKFFITPEEKEKLDMGNETWLANVVATCEINKWNGNEKPQFKIIDMEIEQKLKWDF